MRLRFFVNVFWLPIIGILLAAVYAIDVADKNSPEVGLGSAAVVGCVACFVTLFLDRGFYPTTDSQAVRRRATELRLARDAALAMVGLSVGTIIFLAVALKLNTAMALASLFFLGSATAYAGKSIGDGWRDYGYPDEPMPRFGPLAITPVALALSFWASLRWGLTNGAAGGILLSALLLQIGLSIKGSPKQKEAEEAVSTSK